MALLMRMMCLKLQILACKCMLVCVVILFCSSLLFGAIDAQSSRGKSLITGHRRHFLRRTGRLNSAICPSEQVLKIPPGIVRVNTCVIYGEGGNAGTAGAPSALLRFQLVQGSKNGAPVVRRDVSVELVRAIQFSKEFKTDVTKLFKYEHNDGVIYYYGPSIQAGAKAAIRLVFSGKLRGKECFYVNHLDIRLYCPYNNHVGRKTVASAEPTVNAVHEFLRADDQTAATAAPIKRRTRRHRKKTRIVLNSTEKHNVTKADDINLNEKPIWVPTAPASILDTNQTQRFTSSHASQKLNEQKSNLTQHLLVNNQQQSVTEPQLQLRTPPETGWNVYDIGSRPYMQRFLSKLASRSGTSPSRQSTMSASDVSEMLLDAVSYGYNTFGYWGGHKTLKKYELEHPAIIEANKLVKQG